MFIIHADSVARLRRAVEPLIQVSKKADIKCSAEKLSIIVAPDDFPYVVSLRMAPSFFTSFEFTSQGDGDQEHCSRFLLDLFFRNLCSVHSSVSFTIFLPDRQGLATFKLEDSDTGYLQYCTLVLSRPLNTDVGQIDHRIFVAIRSFKFMFMVSQFPGFFNEIVRVTVTESEVKFSVTSAESVLTTENKECVIGGVAAGRQIQFLITLDPNFFFFRLAFMSYWVWLFKSIGSHDLMSINMGLHANFVVCFLSSDIGRS